MSISFYIKQLPIFISKTTTLVSKFWLLEKHLHYNKENILLILLYFYHEQQFLEWNMVFSCSVVMNLTNQATVSNETQCEMLNENYAIWKKINFLIKFMGMLIGTDIVIEVK